MLERLPFEDLAFEFVRTADGPFFVLGSLCEAFGIDARSQRHRLSNPLRTPWASCRVIMTLQVRGQARSLFCLDLNSVPLWLGTLDTSRVALAMRPRLVEFQRRCAAVLRDFFFGRAVAFDGRNLSRTAALELALDASRERDALDQRVALLTPKAAVADRLTSTEGLHTVEEAAKAIGTGRNRLFRFLRAQRFLLPNGFPYQTHVDAGRSLVREFVFVQNGRERAVGRTHLTAKGLAYVTALWRAKADQTGSETAP
jgi:phage antirepressor YoqD-like protein